MNLSGLIFFYAFFRLYLFFRFFLRLGPDFSPLPFLRFRFFSGLFQSNLFMGFLLSRFLFPCLLASIFMNLSGLFFLSAFLYLRLGSDFGLLPFLRFSSCLSRSAVCFRLIFRPASGSLRYVVNYNNLAALFLFFVKSHAEILFKPKPCPLKAVLLKKLPFHIFLHSAFSSLNHFHNVPWTSICQKLLSGGKPQRQRQARNRRRFWLPYVNNISL